MPVLQGTGSPWTIVLAGGEGERLRAFVRERLGLDRPKQYCTFVGTRSLFQHTIDRADRLVPAERRVTVFAKAHRDMVRLQLAGRRPGHLLAQPVNRGTGTGVLLPAEYIRRLDADATVIVFPSDHFVHPEGRFLEIVARACRLSAKFPSRLVLLAAKPQGEEADYGWVVPAGRLRTDVPRLFRVGRFVEKPDAATAAILRNSGALWSTFIFVGPVRLLVELGRRHVPEVTTRMTRSEPAESLAKPDRLDRLYRDLPCVDFSRRVLASATDALAVLPMDGVFWSDWGRPERVLAGLERIGKGLGDGAGEPKSVRGEPAQDVGSP